jgi:hypothetical protein
MACSAILKSISRAVKLKTTTVGKVPLSGRHNATTLKCLQTGNSAWIVKPKQPAMKKYNLLSLVLISITFTTINCSKEGPAGPAGATGLAGPAGPQGPVGTANVIYSGWFTPAQNGGWVDTTINGVALQKKFNKPAPGVTSGILNTGIIISYMKLNPDGAGGTTTSIRQLPYANPGTATHYLALHYVGSITYAQISTANPGVAVTASSSGLEFRYILIPGGVSGGRLAGGTVSGYTADGLKNMSYEQVTALFNIPPDGSSR